MTALFVIATTDDPAHAVHEAAAHVMMEDDDADEEDPELARIANTPATRAKRSLVRHDIQTLESQIRRAIDQAPDATCELKFYGAGAVAVCE